MRARWQTTETSVEPADAGRCARDLPRRCSVGAPSHRGARERTVSRLAVLSALVSRVLACAPQEAKLPVVARGRYVEIASERDEPVCRGTAAYMDRVIEAVFAVIDETPPDRRFVRFEWLELDEDDPVIGGGRASFAGDGVLIRSDVYLVEEHELVHAAQMMSWPMPNDFLFEGYAVLLDGKRLWHDAYPWPQSASLDDLLEAPNVAYEDYDLAWFVVSQIALDHGFEGLRDFWHAVPRGSSAAEVRAAYQALFGRSIDALVEPYVVDYPDPIGPTEVERRACDFALCPAGEPAMWQQNQWSALGPAGCEDDPDAIGPDQRLLEWGDVWRDYTLLGEPAYYGFDYHAKTSFSVSACELNCDNVATGIENSFEGPPFLSDPVFRGWQSPVRVEVRAARSDLPAAAPGALTVTRSSEPPG